MRRSLLTVLILLPLIFVSLPGSSRGQNDNVVKIGVASMITPVDAVRYYQDIIDYIGQQIGRPVQMVHRRTYEEMDELLENGSVKVAFICSAPYVRNREKFGVELLAAPSVNGKSIYHSYIIVHKDSPVRSFAELRGKTFAFADPKSNTGRLYPVYLLKTMGFTPETFFGKTVYSYSHNKSVELTAKKLVDAAAVDSIVYEYMLKKKSPYVSRTRVIKRSPAFGIPPVVVTRDIDPALKEKIKNAFMKMRGSEKGKAILDSMMIDGFVDISDSSYDAIRKMEHLVGNGTNPAAAKKKQGTVYFGVIPRDNPRLLYEKYQPLLDYLSEKTPYAYELVIKKNYEDTVKAVGSGEIDVALLGPLAFLEARAKYGARILLKPKGADGTASYRSVLVTKKESPIKSVTELKGKRVAFAASKSTTGNLMARYLLAKAGIHLNELDAYTNFDYHDSAVKAVLKGQYDAGAVRDSVARKYMKLGLVAIGESEPIPTGPLAAGPRTLFSVSDNIRKALLELSPRNSADGKVLARLDEDLKNGFAEASDNDYEGIRRMFNAVPNTCGRGCHPRIKL